MSFNLSSGVQNRLEDRQIDVINLLDVPNTGSLSNGDELHLTDYSDQIQYPSGSGHTYQPAALQVGELQQDTSQSVPTMDVDVSNLNRNISGFLHDHDGLTDTEVRIRKIIPDVLASGSELQDITMDIEATSFSRQAATFRLASALDQIDNRLTRTIDHETFPSIPRDIVFIQ